VVLVGLGGTLAGCHRPPAEATRRRWRSP